MNPVNNTSIIDQLDQIPALRPFPQIATRILNACNSPDSTPVEIAELIKCDPAFVAEILKIANSSLYGCPGRVRSVDQAIVLLGFRAIRDLAISIAGAQVFSAGDTANQQRTHLWEHSLATATVARLLASATHCVSPDEAFLAGIFHDVGKLVFFDLAAAEYIPIYENYHWDELPDVEVDRFGISHQEVGNECGTGWGLPPAVLDAIGFHHKVSRAPRHQDLVAITRLADLQSRAWCLVEDSEGEEFDLGHSYVQQSRFDIGHEVLERTYQQSVEAYQELVDICQP